MGAGVAVTPDHVLTAHYLVLGASTRRGGRPRRPRAPRRADEHRPRERPRPARPWRGPASSRPDSALTGSSHPATPSSCSPARARRSGAARAVTSPSWGPFEAFWEYMLDRAIMTTMVNPGLAGGPLLDGRGRVAGIVSLGLAAVGRYSLAIPIGPLQRAACPPRERRAGARAERRAWIGFYPQAHDDGVAVSGVVPGGPAESGRPAAGRPARQPRRPRGPEPAPALPRVVAQGARRGRGNAGPARGENPRHRDRGGRPLRVLQVKDPCRY